MNCHIQKYSVTSIKSICWMDDALVDWVGGGKTLRLDGSVGERRVIYSFGFDSAVTSVCGRYAVIYQKLGTKGLILREGKILREINRSFYHADVYEFPIAIFQALSGRVLIAHCPDEYCQLDFEDIETGERLTRSEERKPSDFFHSRLRVSPDGKWLLSAGWVWHPWSDLALFDIEAALLDPKTLDRSGPTPKIDGEVSAAEFLPDGRIIFCTSDDSLDGEDAAPDSVSRNSIAIFHPQTLKVSLCVSVSEQVGSMMPINDEMVVGFYEHPKLFSLKSGEVIQRWDEINSGKQTSSILISDDLIPPIACDSTKKRFAVADTDSVVVVDIGS